jgi:hypothetical protein
VVILITVGVRLISLEKHSLLKPPTWLSNS